MPTPWAARLGLVSMSVLALAACNRGQHAQTAAGSDATAPAGQAGLDAGSAATGAAEPMSAGEATASVAPAPSPAAAAAAPEIAAARSLDQAVSAGSASDAQAYGFQGDDGQVRIWDEGSRGSRIVLPGGAISYYRPGAADPYLLREGDTFYVLTAGRVARAYDSRGRVVVLQPAVRTRVETVITRTRTVRRAAEQRRPTPTRVRRDDRDAARADAAQDNARDANKDARQAEKQADKARDSAQDAQHAANRAERQAETPRQEDKARDAQRQANKADRQADKAADQAKDATKAARDARQLAAQCARQKARGDKVDKDCAA